MLFSEVYSGYFSAVAQILAEAARGGVTEARMREIAREKAFEESIVRIPDALLRGEWPLLTRERVSVLRHPPDMPLTALQRRWLKSLLLDPRIRLFDPPADGLEDVEPLFSPGDIVIFDRCAGGDPYDDEVYIRNFRTVLAALRENRALRVRFRGGTGVRHTLRCLPCRLEYSRKDDAFRLLAVRGGGSCTINMARIRSCALLEPCGAPRMPEPSLCELVLSLRDERNALERVLLHFSDLEKETVKIGEDRYRLTLRYRAEDESEMLIRVLSFGPMVKEVYNTSATPAEAQGR